MAVIVVNESHISQDKTQHQSQQQSKAHRRETHSQQDKEGKRL